MTNEIIETAAIDDSKLDAVGSAMYFAAATVARYDYASRKTMLTQARGRLMERFPEVGQTMGRKQFEMYADTALRVLRDTWCVGEANNRYIFLG